MLGERAFFHVRTLLVRVEQASTNIEANVHGQLRAEAPAQLVSHMFMVSCVLKHQLTWYGQLRAVAAGALHTHTHIRAFISSRFMSTIGLHD